MSDHKKHKHDDQHDIDASKSNTDIDEKDAKIKNFEEKYLRAVADYQNLQRRTEQERFALIANANERLIKKFLEVMDDLENSILHIEDSGLKSIVEKMRKLLAEEGLEEIPTADADFQPELHEAIEITKGPKDKIIRTYRKGYMLNEKLIRPSMVAVGNGEKD